MTHFSEISLITGQIFRLNIRNSATTLAASPDIAVTCILIKMSWALSCVTHSLQCNRLYSASHSSTSRTLSSAFSSASHALFCVMHTSSSHALFCALHTFASHALFFFTRLVSLPASRSHGPEIETAPLINQ